MYVATMQKLFIYLLQFSAKIEYLLFLLLVGEWRSFWFEFFFIVNILSKKAFFVQGQGLEKWGPVRQPERTNVRLLHKQVAVFDFTSSLVYLPVLSCNNNVFLGRHEDIAQWVNVGNEAARCLVRFLQMSFVIKGFFLCQNSYWQCVGQSPIINMEKH